MRDAQCAKPDAESEWFFPRRGFSGDIAMAKFTCFTCPVQVECRKYREVTDSVGIWAGENYSEE